MIRVLGGGLVLVTGLLGSPGMGLAPEMIALMEQSLESTITPPLCLLFKQHQLWKDWGWDYEEEGACTSAPACPSGGPLSGRPGIWNPFGKFFLHKALTR